MQNVQIILIGLFIFLLNYNLDAQQDTSKNTIPSILTSDIKRFWCDAGDITVSPLSFSANHWLTLGAVLGGTAFIFTIDEPIHRQAKRHQSETASDIVEIGRVYGRGRYVLGFSSSLYLTGLFFNNNDIRKTGFMMVESILFAGGITFAIKGILARSRPYLNEGAFEFNGLEFSNYDMMSMPSGHATFAFAISTVLSAQIKNPLATMGFYTLATLTTASRVYYDQHWASDTFLGAAIGTTIGLMVVDLHEKRDHQTGFNIYPVLNGLRAELRF